MHTCDHCGKRYQPRNRNQRWCSASCRRGWWRDARRIARPTPRVATRYCATCGKVIGTHRLNSPFCSYICMMIKDLEIDESTKDLQ